MITAINPFLNFHGEAAEAIAFYQRAVGAELVAIMRWRDMPGEVPEALADLVMYSKLAIGGGVIEVSDVPPEAPVEVTKGDTPFVAVQIDDPDELDRVCAALVEGGGETQMPPEDTFWNARYALVRDRFGVRWSFNCQRPGDYEDCEDATE